MATTAAPRLFPSLIVFCLRATLRRMSGSRRLTTAMLSWLFPLVLLVLVVAVALAPAWLVGLIGVVVFGVLGYGGVAWYYRRSPQFHDSEHHQQRRRDLSRPRDGGDGPLPDC